MVAMGDAQKSFASKVRVAPSVAVPTSCQTASVGALRCLAQVLHSWLLWSARWRWVMHGCILTVLCCPAVALLVDLISTLSHEMRLQLLNESFGFFSVRGLAAWTFAGVVAYAYIVVPQQQEERKAMVRPPLMALQRCRA